MRCADFLVAYTSVGPTEQGQSRFTSAWSTVCSKHHVKTTSQSNCTLPPLSRDMSGKAPPALYVAIRMTSAMCSKNLICKISMKLSNAPGSAGVHGADSSTSQIGRLLIRAQHLTRHTPPCLLPAISLIKPAVRRCNAVRSQRLHTAAATTTIITLLTEMLVM